MQAFLPPRVCAPDKSPDVGVFQDILGFGVNVSGHETLQGPPNTIYALRAMRSLL